MPDDHRGNHVDGPSRNCANCNAAGKHKLQTGHSLCTTCYRDYMSFHPYMWQKSMHPKWEEE